MKKENLFQYLETQDKSVLFELLESAFDSMETQQKNEVFWTIYKDIPPIPVDGEEVLEDIEEFYSSSMSGYYYEPFDINSKNFSNVPEETQQWFDELGDHLEDCSKLTDQGDHEIAIQCFNILHKLIDEMESGEEIVFADEYGTWMISGDHKRFARSYLISLSAISNPVEYSAGAFSIVVGNFYSSYSNKIYSIALDKATEEQKRYLQKKVETEEIGYNTKRYFE